MIVVKKKMKKPLIIVILAACLAVLIGAAILINTLIAAQNSNSGSTDGGTKLPEIIPEIGEVISSKKAVAYTPVSEQQIKFISVVGEYDYSFYRPDSEGEKKNSFILSYRDDEGNIQTYYPLISMEDPTFSYEDMFAFEQNDNYGTIYKLTYLCSAIGTPYFDERIKVDDDEEKRNEELRAFGLSKEDKTVRIYFNYYNKDGVEEEHYLTLGESLIVGRGYYFMVDDRPYVYTTYSTYFDYAMLSFADFIKPILVCAGLEQDGAFEPYLTTDFKQWKNTLYLPYVDEKSGNYVHYNVLPDSTVILNATVKKPDYDGDKDSSDPKGGYNVSEEKNLTFDLSSYKKDKNYQRFVNYLLGKSTGDYANTLNITIPTSSSAVNFADGTADKYTYEIVSVEALITENGGDITAVGVEVGNNNIVKIGYNLKVNGELVSEETFFGVIDISSELVSDEVESAIRAMKVGELSTPYSFEVDYNENNSVTEKVDMLITDILEIVSSTDTGTKHEKVQLGSKVAVRYKLILNGEEVDGVDEFIIEITENMEGDSKKVADAIMGKATGSYEIEVDAYTRYSEIVCGFTSYEIGKISYFYTKEQIVSFAFEQASNRDEYYGESIYLNTMEGKYSMYGLNSPSCENVVRLIGGLMVNATRSEGLVGNKTVDVVITPEKMLKYGLYANHIYFELPRGITAVEYSGGNIDDYLSSLDDYTYLSTIGFNIYISEEDPITKTRYMASDLFDIIVEISSENFEFLDYSFVDFYARKNVILTKVDDIENIKLEFFMDDFSGTYNNDLIHYEMYAYGGKVGPKEKFTEEELKTAVKVNLLDISVKPTGTNTETELSKYLASHGLESTTLRDLYDGKTVEIDSLGTSYFREFTETLFYTYYESTLTEDEQNSASAKLLMKMTVQLFDGYSSYDYVYEFHRISDRRVMVKLYRESRFDGSIMQGSEVSEFYISTFAFKKIVNVYMGILNKQPVSNEEAFGDYGNF